MAGPGSVDGRRCGILEDRDGFDVVGVERFEHIIHVSGTVHGSRTETGGGRYGKSVDHDERFVTGTRGRLAANPQFRAAARLGRHLTHGESRGLSGQRLRNVRHRSGFQVGHAHNRNSSRKGLFRLLAVTDHHNVAHKRRILRHLDSEICTAADRHGLRLITEVTHHEACRGAGNNDPERSVRTAGRTLGRTLDHDARANQRIPGLILHNALHGLSRRSRCRRVLPQTQKNLSGFNRILVWGSGKHLIEHCIQFSVRHMDRYWDRQINSRLIDEKGVIGPLLDHLQDLRQGPVLDIQRQTPGCPFNGVNETIANTQRNINRSLFFINW